MDRPLGLKRLGWSTPTVLAWEDLLVVADRDPLKGEKSGEGPVKWEVDTKGGGLPGTLTVYEAETGKVLWSAPCEQNYNAPADVFVINGELWRGRLRQIKSPGFTEILDIRTGKVLRTLEPDPNRRVGMPHHRCYRNKATVRFILTGRAGVETIDVKTGESRMHNWVRGTCQYGIVPANGLIYAPPHSCACFLKAKLDSFNAVAGVRDLPLREPGNRLVKGPAFGKAEGEVSQTDWPTYRHDPQRSGSASCTLSPDLEEAWSVDLEGNLTAPVVADGRLFIAQTDAHALHALDAETGKSIWKKVAGGRIDSPPTVHGGTILFGCADGTVTCLRASDGEPVWRFLAAPEDRRIVAFDRLESVWPVPGSILVKDGEACFAAGRSSYLDGGMRLYRLNAETGELLSTTTIDDRDPETGVQPLPRGFHLPGSLPDILSTDGTHLFLRQRAFDEKGAPLETKVPHLFSMTGFLDDSWWHRTYWLVSGDHDEGWKGWWRTGNAAPSGRILSMTDREIFGFGRSAYPSRNAGQWNEGEHYRLFASDRAPSPASGEKGKNGGKERWSIRPPLQGRALLAAGDLLFVAGPPNDPAKAAPLGPFTDDQDSLLWAVSTVDGTKRGELGLDALPVFDGMIAAGGRLYLAQKDGRVLCFRGK